MLSLHEFWEGPTCAYNDDLDFIRCVARHREHSKTLFPGSEGEEKSGSEGNHYRELESLGMTTRNGTGWTVDSPAATSLRAASVTFTPTTIVEPNVERMDSPTSTSSTDLPAQHPFTFLRAFPWISSYVLDAEDASQLFDNPRLTTYGTGIQEIAMRLITFEKEVPHLQGTPSLEAVLLGDPVSSIVQRLSVLNGLNQERLAFLASVLLDYRLIDVVLSIQEHPRPCGQPRLLKIPMPAKMYYKQVGNWPVLVSRSLQLLKDCEDDDYNMDVPEPTDPVVSIFKSLVQRREAIDGHKIHANFECATAHLSLILKGIVELPTTVPEFKGLILEMCQQEGISVERWGTFFEAIKTVHSFKLPLQMALAVSPLCLFLPCSIMNKDLNQRTLLQMWQGLGGQRPDLLTLIETNLWKALFETASGMFPMRSRFRAAFRAVGMIDLSQVGYPSSEWLAGDPSFQESLQPSAVPDGRRAKPKRKSEPRPSDAMVTDDDVAEPKPEDISPRRHGLRPCSPQVGDVGTVQGAPPATSRRSKGHLPTERSGTARGSSQDRRRSIRRGKARAVSEPEFSDSDSEETDYSDMYTDASPTVRKRTISSVSDTKPLHPEHTVKAMKMEDGTRLDIFERIDLSREARGPPVIDLTLDEDGPERPFTSSCTIWLSHGRSKYVARFHYREEAEWFTSLFRTMKLCRPKDTNQTFTFLTTLQVTGMAVSNLQQLLRRNVLLLLDNAQSNLPPFDSRTLASFCMLDKPISVVDFSISPTLTRIATGMLNQLLQSSQSSGKALAALDLPIPDGTSPLLSLASDIVAWDLTIDTPWCGRQWELPRSTFRWAEVSTRDSYRPFGVSSNGCVTQIKSKAGSQLLIVCMPSVFNPHSIMSIAMLEQTLQPYISDRKSFDFQAYHLQAGDTAVIRPLVPYIILSTANSITHVCSFYASSTLQASCIGFLHSSLSRNPASNPSQRPSQSLLRRLVHYYHTVYMSPDYIALREEFPHVPDVTTTDGLINVLSLCNLFELSSVVAYTLSDLDRHLLIEARRLCRTIVAWLQARLAFSDSQGRPLNASHDLWLPYLAHQVRALQVYQEALECRQSSSHPPGAFLKKLEACFQDQPDFMERVRGIRTGSDHLGWPEGLIFSIIPRVSPNAVPGDIRGEAGDDVANFGI